MRLQQTTAETAPSMPRTPALGHGAEASQTQGPPANVASLAGEQGAQVDTLAGITPKVTQQVTRHAALLPTGDALKTSAIGLLVGVAGRGMFLYPMHLAALNIGLIVYTFVAFLLLAMALSFGLGCKQQSGIRGALSGLVLGVTVSAGFLVGLAVLPDRPMASLHLVPFLILPFEVMLGTLGGVCGRTRQTWRARRGKANR